MSLYISFIYDQFVRQVANVSHINPQEQILTLPSSSSSNPSQIQTLDRIDPVYFDLAHLVSRMHSFFILLYSLLLPSYLSSLCST